MTETAVSVGLNVLKILFSCALNYLAKNRCNFLFNCMEFKYRFNLFIKLYLFICAFLFIFYIC